jgi:molybdopterin/thiamine biosynthesis adenylyltransferase
MTRLDVLRYIRQSHPEWHWTYTPSMLDGWMIKIKVGDYDFEILLEIVDWEFFELPTVYLKQPSFKNFEKLLPLPHLSIYPKEFNNSLFYNLCYAVTNSLAYDNYDSIGIIEWCYKQTIKVLGEIFINKSFSKQEALREIVPIWNQISNANNIRLASWFEDNPTNMLMQNLKNLSYLNFLEISQENQGFYRFISKDIKDKSFKVFILEPMLISEFNGFPNSFVADSPPYAINLQVFLNWIKSFSTKNYQTLIQKIIDGINATQQSLFLGCLIVNNQTLTFGIEHTALKNHLSSNKKVKSKKTVLESGFKFHDCWVVLTESINLTPNFVYKRNIEKLLSDNLSDKKIVLIGCGAIGGYLGLALAKLGAGAGNGELILIDEDIIKAENIGRHVLGKFYVRHYKSTSLKFEIQAQLSALKVTSYEENIINAKMYKLLEDADLIIDATAKAEVSQRLNEVYFNTSAITSPVIFSWIRGNGECVQSLFVDKQVKSACRCCLNRSGHPIRDQYDALPGFEPVVNFSACSDYTPFSVSASQSASALAIDLVLDWLRGEVGPRYRTRYTERWTGSRIESADYLPHQDCHVCQIRE